MPGTTIVTLPFDLPGLVAKLQSTLQRRLSEAEISAIGQTCGETLQRFLDSHQTNTLAGSTSDNQPLVFLGIPYLGDVSPIVVPSIQGATIGQCRVDVCMRDVTGCITDLMMSSISLHGANFNHLWCEALNNRPTRKYTEWCMHHADLGAGAGWLDKLVSIRRLYEADVVSAVVPIKSDDGYSSTALAPKNSRGMIRRITMQELYARDSHGNCLIPDTFSAEDVERAWGLPVGTHNLYVNTGLWVCDFSKPWIEDFPGFDVLTRIIKLANGRREPRSFSEDWHFSWWAQHEAGLRVLATRAVGVDHMGGRRFSNNHAWGTAKTDQKNIDGLNDWLESPACKNRWPDVSAELKSEGEKK